MLAQFYVTMWCHSVRVNAIARNLDENIGKIKDIDQYEEFDTRR